MPQLNLQAQLKKKEGYNQFIQFNTKLTQQLSQTTIRMVGPKDIKLVIYPSIQYQN